MVSSSYDGTLRLWDAADGEKPRTLEGHTGGVGGCAVSPDGTYVVSAGDRTLRLWDVAVGGERAVIPLLSGVNCVALHPWLALAACGDHAGNVYLIDLIAIEYGPIIVTATERGSGPAVRCPACWQEHPLEEGWLGEVIDCPTSDCDLRLRVNPFVLARTDLSAWR